VAVLFGAIALHALVLFILKNENELIFLFFSISVFCKKKQIYSHQNLQLYTCAATFRKQTAIARSIGALRQPISGMCPSVIRGRSVLPKGNN
jgi:NADH:ubiquinone oxidoreductase subunit 4 (subunit M)